MFSKVPSRFILKRLFLRKLRNFCAFNGPYLEHVSLVLSVLMITVCCINQLVNFVRHVKQITIHESMAHVQCDYHSSFQNNNTEEEEIPQKDPPVQHGETLPEEPSDVDKDITADKSALNESFATDTISSAENAGILPDVDKMGDPITSVDCLEATNMLAQPGDLLEEDTVVVRETPALDKIEVIDNIEAESSPTKEVLPTLDKMGDPIVEDNLTFSSEQGEVLSVNVVTEGEVFVETGTKDTEAHDQ